MNKIIEDLPLPNFSSFEEATDEIPTKKSTDDQNYAWFLGKEIKLGELLGYGSYGKVYSSKLLDQTKVAVKTLSSRKAYRNEKNINELLQKLEIDSKNAYNQLSAKFITKYYGDALANLPKEEVSIQPAFIFEEIEGTSAGRYTIQNLNLEKRSILMAQIAAGLHNIHMHGVIHRDLKLNNIIINHDQIVKILDFGLAIQCGSIADPLYSTISNNYCAPIEIFKYIEKYERKIPNEEAKLQLNQILQPSYDIYGLGMILLSSLFGSKSSIILALIFHKIKHENFQENIKIREDLYLDIKNFLQTKINSDKSILQILNDTMPEQNRYSNGQLKFIANAILLCLDPNPINRPTAAQIGECFELFAAGCEDFEETMRLAKEDRPSKLSIYKPVELLDLKQLGSDTSNNFSKIIVTEPEASPSDQQI